MNRTPSDLLQSLKNEIKNKVFCNAQTYRQKTALDPEKYPLSEQWIFDFRSTTLQAHNIDAIAELFWERYAQDYPFQVGGLESASIPLIAAIVMKSVEKNKPVNGFFIRKERKFNSLSRVIEGEISSERIILVDDVLNTGRTFERQIAVLKELNKKVSEIFVLLRYKELTEYPSIKENDIRISSLFTLPDFDINFLRKSYPATESGFEIKWKFQSSKPSFEKTFLRTSIALDEKKLYFGADNGTFYALNQSDGSIRWKQKIGFRLKGNSFSCPLIYRDTVYLGAYDGNFYAFNSSDGKKKWIFMEADWTVSTPTISPEQKILFTGLQFGIMKKHGGLGAIGLDTGKIKWIFRTKKQACTSPLYIRDKNTVALGTDDPLVFLLYAKTGTLIWQQKVDGYPRGSFTYYRRGNYIIFTTTKGLLYIIDAKNGTPLHIFAPKEESGMPFSSPVIYDDSVYFSSRNKCVYRFNLDTFKLMWRYRAKGRFYATPIIVEGRLYIGSGDGRGHEIDISNGRSVGFFQVVEGISNGMVYNPMTRKFFAPTLASAIYCMEKLSK